MEKIKRTLIILLILSFTQCKEDCIKTDRCNLIANAGPCYALITKYYYDKEEKRCKPFTYGGCDGLVPFDTLEECKKGCQCD